MIVACGAKTRLFSPFYSRLHFLLIFTVLILTVALNTVVGRADTLTVAAGGDLQLAINSANCGDTVSVEAGSSFFGNFYLPVKPCTDASPVTIQSSRASELPAGVRVTPDNAALMPKLRTPNTEPALSTLAGAHHYKIVGVEFVPAHTNFMYEVVTLGDPSAAQDTQAEVPHHISIDRCYIHANGDQTVMRGIDLNVDYAEVMNSHVSGFKSTGGDTQAILIFNAFGPFLIENNYLEASGENFMVGGADCKLANCVPSDVTFRRNHLSKPLSWRGVWMVKNLLELKNARRVLIDSNLMEYSWASGQAGFAIVFTPRNQEGSNPQATVEDVMFTNNVIRHAASGFQILGHDNLYPSQTTKRITIRNNLLEDISSSWAPGLANKLFLMIDGAEDVTIERNTAKGDATALYFTGAPQMQRLVVRQNAFESGTFASSEGNGTAALTAYAPGAVVTGNYSSNVFQPELYPTNNTYIDPLPDPLPSGVGYVPGGTTPTPTPNPSPTPTPDPNPLPTPTPTPTPEPNPLPTPTPTPTPEPTPLPTPTPTPTQTGESILSAKRDGQILSNQLASSGGASAMSSVSIEELAAPETEALQRFIAEIQTADLYFDSERDVFPAAARIQVELDAALQRASQAEAASSQGDLAGVRTHLRAAITHLELAGVLIANPNIANPIDSASYVVRQHYLDFLDREPDQAGSDYWVSQMSSCGTNAQCLEYRRINVSAAFFLSMEFQETGYFVYRVYKSSYRRVPTRLEFMPDNVFIGQGVIVGTAGWEARLAANKDQFLQNWVQRSGFISRYAYMSDAQYVDTLIFNIGVTVSTAERNALIQDLANGASRASVLGRLADNQLFSTKEFNTAFVLMQYFGYLRRDFDNAGFTFWLNKLNQFGGNYQSAEMVKAFLSSQEYRRRFLL